MKILLMTVLLTLLMTTEAMAEEPVAGISVVLDKVKDIEISSISESETTVLYRIVEAEATGETIECKKNVASVIMNRVHNQDFPDTISDVVFQNNQFTPIVDKRYWSVEISEETIVAVDDVIKNGTTMEALFFVNLEKTTSKMKRWFRSLEFVYKDSSGHSFYK